MKTLFLISLLVSVLTQKSWAQIDSDMIQKKLQIEKEFTSVLADKIKTTLDPKFFDISVQVSLEEYTPPSKKNDGRKGPDSSKAEKDKVLPLDAKLGLIDTEKLIQDYKNEIQLIQESKKTIVQIKEDNTRSFRIKQVTIFAGLKEELGPAYIAEFEKWLNAFATNEYGKKTKVSVQTVKRPLQINKIQEIEPWSLRNDLKQFETLIATVLAALSLFILLLLSKLIESKDAKSLRSLKVDLLENSSSKSQNKLPETLALPAKDDNKLPEQQFQHEKLTQQIENVRENIRYLILSSDNRLKEMFAAWLDEGDKSILKASNFVEILVSLRIKNLSDAEKTKIHDILKVLDFSKTVKTKIIESLRQMTNQLNQQRLQILDQIYWEIVASQTSDVNQFNVPFGYLDQLSEKDILPFLSDQPLNVKSMVIMAMPKPNMEKIIKNLSFEDTKEIVKKSLEIDEINSAEVTMISEALKIKFSNFNVQDNKIKTISVLPDILTSLSFSEQFSVLSEFETKFADKMQSLRREFVTLYWIDSWHDQYRKKFLESLDTDSVLALLFIRPKLKTSVLAALTERAQIIVNDDLQLPPPPAEELERRLAVAHNKLNHFLQKNSKSVSDIIENKMNLSAAA